MRLPSQYPALLLLAIALNFCSSLDLKGRPLLAQPAERYDLLLMNGLVFIGDGQPAVEADIAITKGKIAAVAKNLVVDAVRTIDCEGLVVSPGFIDLHTHSDEEILEIDTRANSNYLMQGCTTIVTGNCGMGHVDVAKYFSAIDASGVGTNVAHLLPHGSLRSKVMGKEDREPTSEELRRMEALAERGMLDGAFGMTTGLIYVPGTFAKTDELIAIAKVVAKHQGIYASHIRGEGRTLLKSVEEAIHIGTEAKLPTHVSHFKASGKQSWGSLHLAAKIIEDARRDGKKVTADQYPYAASSTSLEATLLPSWSRSGGRTELKKRLADPETASRIRKAILEDLKTSTRIQIASFEARRDWVGKSLDEIAKGESMEVVEVVLYIEKNGGASVVNFGMSEDDVQLAMKYPWVATASDGRAKKVSTEVPHPRSYGTFPRKIGHYAISEQIVSLEAAIRSATSLPAEILGLSDRGLLKEGMVADITIFDPKHFRDHATFENPYRPTTGLKHVLIAGEFAVYEGVPTDALLGKAIRKRHEKGH
jgi:N-acyl-D-amino-acid deacylase